MKFAALALFVVAHGQKIPHTCTTLYQDKNTRDNWSDQCEKACEPYRTTGPENAADEGFFVVGSFPTSCSMAGTAVCTCFYGLLTGDCSQVDQGLNRGYCCPVEPAGPSEPACQTTTTAGPDNTAGTGDMISSSMPSHKQGWLAQLLGISLFAAFPCLA